MAKAIAKNIRQGIESFFESWSQTVVKHPWTVLLTTLLISFSIIPQIRHGWVDVSIESFLPKNDPAIVDYDEFRLGFNYVVGAMVVVEIPDGIYSMEALNKIKTFHETLENEVPFTEDVLSIADMRYTRGEDDEMLVGDLSEIWPETEEDIPAFREVIRNNPNYLGSIISENEKVVVYIIEPYLFSNENTNPNESGMTYLQAHEETAFAEKIFELTERFDKEDFIVLNAGGPTMNLGIAQDMEKSTGRSTLFGLIIIVILLALLFRRASGVILPLSVVFLSLMMTMALWPTLGYPYNGNTQIIPTFILAVGIADAIHILSIFYKYYDNGEAKEEAISHAIRETAIAVLLTTATTAAGLLSFLASDMMPTRTLGIFGAIGVIMALFYTLALVPSVLAIFPIKAKRIENSDNATNSGSIEKTYGVLNFIDRIIQLFSDIGVNHAKKVVLVSTALSAIALVGVIKVNFSHDPVSWYPKDNDLPVAIKKVDSTMNGTMTAYVVIETHEKYGIQDPKFIQALADTEELIENYQYKDVDAIQTTSILSVIRETNQALNNNNPSFYTHPNSREMIAQELLLFESGSDDLYKYTNFEQSIARVDIQLLWSNVLHYREYVQNLTVQIESLLAERGYQNATVKMVGLLPIFGETLNSLLEGTTQSYIMAFAFVLIIMILLMESVKRGLLAFAPNVFPILLTVGLIGLLDMPLNIITSTLGCVVIGISVDDTIHFMHHFRRYSKEYDDIKEIIDRTLHTCGRAIFFTSVVLVGGFIVHLTGELSTNKEFGWLLSIAIILALIANLILAPALMTLYWGRDKD